MNQSMDESSRRAVALALIVVRTEQAEKLLEFYRAVGLQFVAERHGNGPVHHSANLEGVVFEVYPAAKHADVDRATRLGFRVADPHSVVAALRSAGASIVAEAKQTEWGIRAVVHDPDGRAVELYSL